MSNKVRYTLKEREHNAKKFKFSGTACLRQGKFREAVDQYRLATIFNPHLKTDILLDYERLIYLDSKNLAARFSLANYYLSVSEKEFAIEELEDLLEINPYIIEVYNLLGKMYLELGRIEDCIQLLERAFLLGIKDLNLTETLAGAYLEKNMLGRAAALYEDLLNFEGKNKKLLRILGDLYCRQSRFEEAAGAFSTMLEGDAAVIEEVELKLDEIRAMAPQNIAVLKYLAEAYIKNIKPSRALECYQEILKLDPHQLDKIISHLRRILTLYPSHPESILILAQALTQKGQFSEAAQMYGKVVKVSPELSEQAIKGYREIIAIYPSQVLAHQLLSVAYLAKDKIEDAIFEFNKLLDLSPADLSFVDKKSQQLFLEGRDGTALRLLMARIALLKEDYSRAQTEVQQVLNQSPKQLEAHVLQANIFQKMKLYDQALAAIRRAIQLNPYDALIQQIFTQISFENLAQEIYQLTQPKPSGQITAADRFKLGQDYFWTEDIPAAIEQFQLLSSDSEFGLPALEFLGKCFILQNRFDLASAQFKKMKTKFANFKLGLCKQACGDISAALKLFNEIYSEDVNFSTLKERLSHLHKISPLSLKNKTLICLLTPELRTKKTAAWCGTDNRTQRPKGSELLSYSFGQAHESDGLKSFFCGNYAAAEEEFLVATQLDPKLPSALNNLGIIYLLKEEFSLAQEYFKRAQAIDSTSPIILNNLGAADFLLGNYSFAEAQLLKATALDHNQNVSDINLGAVLYQNGSIKEALLLWEKYEEFHLVSDFVQQILRYKRVKADV
jgi:tetratricopeptide (TPR) repeat protein